MSKKDKVLINESIEADLVRLIGPDGKHEGELSSADALVNARDRGMDLVMIVASATPPVCKIMDYGKFKYTQKKKDRKNRSSGSTPELKEVRFRLKIEKHDFDVKINRSLKFLEKGHRVKISVMYRGRERTHPELGHKLLGRIRDLLTEKGKVIQEPTMDGNFLGMVIDPVK